MNVQQANLEDLLATYYDGTSARYAARLLRRLIDRHAEAQVAELLRDYRKRPITSATEMEVRADVDRLLTCYSMLEIAAIAGFVPGNLEDHARHAMAEARHILGHEHVRKYYEMYYPMRLPRLLYRRLKGHHAYRERPAEGLLETMLALLDLDRRFTSQLEDGTLLRMLDSFVINGCSFDDVVAVIANPEKFIDMLLLEKHAADPRAQAVRELGPFTEFCFDLQALLRRAADHPVLQSTIWSYYGYWFEIIGVELRASLEDAMDQFLLWQPPAESVQTAQDVQRYVASVKSVLTDLTSGQLSGPTDALLEASKSA